MALTQVEGEDAPGIPAEPEMPAAQHEMQDNEERGPGGPVGFVTDARLWKGLMVESMRRFEALGENQMPLSEKAAYPQAGQGRGAWQSGARGSARRH